MKVSSCANMARSTALCLVLLNGVSLVAMKPARAQGQEPSLEQLQSEIRSRDAVIEKLVQRVDKLERQLGQASTAQRTAPAERRPPPSAPRQAVAAQPAPAGGLPPPVSPANPPTPSPPAQEASKASPQGAPGQFQVDVDAAQRALERTLTTTGALLVPYGWVDLEPSFTYARRETPSLVLFNNERNEYTAGLAARFGLPWESQITLGLPYLAAGQQVVNNFVSPVQQVSSGFGTGLGDLTISLSKTLLHQSGGWRPDLIGAISYEAPTGVSSANHVPLPGDQSRLGFSLTALKRQDPLAFVLSVGYTKSFERHNLQPGDQVSILGGAYLATSPQTTLSAVLQQNFIQAPTLNGVTLTGANTVQTQLLFGASSILGKGVLLNLQVGVGLTRDAPKYSVILSFPIRFHM